MQNGLNINVITYSIIKNKIFKSLLNLIFLNNLYYLLSYDFHSIHLYDLLGTNKYYTKISTIINKVGYNNNKYNRI